MFQINSSTDLYADTLHNKSPMSPSITVESDQNTSNKANQENANIPNRDNINNIENNNTTQTVNNTQKDTNPKIINEDQNVNNLQTNNVRTDNVDINKETNKINQHEDVKADTNVEINNQEERSVNNETSSVREVNICKMNELFKDAMEMLQLYIVRDSNNNNSHKIPLPILNQAKGIMFLRCWKAGILVGGSRGSGILLSRCNDDWSGPCALNFQSVTIGFDIGVEKIDHILLLNDDLAFRMFQNKGAFHLGVSGEISAGVFDKDLDKGLMKTDISKSIISYSFSKGVYAGLSLEGSIITMKEDYNDEYYGQKVSAIDIIYDKVQKPRNELDSKLTSLLKQYHTA